MLSDAINATNELALKIDSGTALLSESIELESSYVSEEIYSFLDGQGENLLIKDCQKTTQNGCYI